MAWAEPTKGGKFIGRYKDAQGRNKSAGTHSSRRDAIKAAREQETKIQRGTWVDPSAGKVTFSSYFEQWAEARHVELNTCIAYWTAYNTSLKAEFGHRPIRTINHSLVQGWVDKQAATGVSPRTIQQRFATLQTCLAGRKRGSSAMRDRLIEHNPCEFVSIPKVTNKKVEVYTPDELDAILDNIPEWYWPIIFLDSETGVRWGELMGFKVDDLTLNYRSVWVNETILELSKKYTGNGTRFLRKPHPKDDEPRFLALSDDASAMLRTSLLSAGSGPEIGSCRCRTATRAYRSERTFGRRGCR